MLEIINWWKFIFILIIIHIPEVMFNKNLNSVPWGMAHASSLAETAPKLLTEISKIVEI